MAKNKKKSNWRNPSGVVGKAADKVSEQAKSTVDTVAKAADKVTEQGKSTVADAVSGVTGAAGSLGEKAAGAAGSLGGKAAGAAGSLGGKAAGAAGSLGEKAAGATSGIAGIGSGASGSSAGAARSAGTSGSSTATSGGEARTTTQMTKEVTWERRKAWPLLLGSAAVLGGASAAHYSWANPDGKLTPKAQAALAKQFPGAKVRVHGRDAIISNLPAGADSKAAHDLVRHIEGIRNVKEEGTAIANGADTAAAETPAETAVPVDTAAPTDTAAPAETTAASLATEAAPAVATETAPETAAPTEAPTTEVAATEAPATEAPTTEAPSTEAPTTEATVPAETPTTVAPATPAAEATAAPEPKILFDSVSTTLDTDGQNGVAEIVAFLNANPDARVRVVGHADSYGTRLTNLNISRSRADAVVQALVNGGIDRSRISAFAAGDRSPIESNATSAGRKANRRVDVSFTGISTVGQDVNFTG